MTPTRRQTLRALLVSAAAPLAPGCAVRGEGTTMRALGIQLYMLKEPLERDFQGTLNQVAAIGYRQVELAGFHNRSGAELRQALNEAGLTCVSAHVPLDAYRPGQASLSDPATIEILHSIGVTQAVVPVFPLTTLNLASIRSQAELGAAIWQIGRRMTGDDWRAFAHRLNETGRILARSGLHVGYHNHNLEYETLNGGVTPLDILIRETDPTLVSFELDVGWAAAAGIDAAAFLDAHADRINQLHLKDAAARTGTGFGFTPASLGAGIVDWSAILQAVNRAPRIDHLYVEQEEPFQTPPLDDARVAFDFLRDRPELRR